MKVGDRLCIMGSRKMPSGFILYYTNVIPMNVSIPDFMTPDEATEMLLSVAKQYEKAVSRYRGEQEAKAAEIERQRPVDPGVVAQPEPTLEQIVERALR